MLQRMWIENFKAVGLRVEVDLRPVTLLFGPNSAGKSSILHAIHYFHAVLETGNADVERTRLGGGLDLGGFRNVVHRHDLERAVKIGFEFTPDPEGELNRIKHDILGWSTEYERASGELHLRYSALRDQVIVERFAVTLEGAPLASIVASSDGRRVRLEGIHRGNEGLSPLIEGGSDDDVSAMVDDLDDREKALPLLSGRVPEEMPHLGDPYDYVTLLIVDTVGRELASELSRFRYVGPIRRAPERQYAPPKVLDESRWASGLGAWDAMASDLELTAAVSGWLEGKDALDTGYGLEVRPYWEVDDALLSRMRLAAANRELDEWFNALSREFRHQPRLEMVDRATDDMVAPCDLGEGIAQVVPVVAAALSRQVATPDGKSRDSNLVAIEQPELHIHPRMQVVLGDLFLSQCSDRQFFVETHSEHLMLRLLRRVRETTDGELPVGAWPATPETIAIHYVEPGPEGATVVRIPVTADGEFGERWPEGFFAERMEELL